MTTNVPKQATIAALADVWASLDELLAGLHDDEWARPTCLPGWDVKAVVAHVAGTESMLLGEQAPDVEVDEASHPHVRNDIGRFNERWVVATESESPAEVLERFRVRIAARRAALDELTDEAWFAVGFTPAGQDTYGRFMRIRTFDCWLHEQDIRDAVGRPGGEDGLAAPVALDEIAAVLGYVVGKKAGAPLGSRVRFELTGPAARTIDVEVAERAAVVNELSGPPTVTVTMPAGVFARLGGGRIDPSTVRDQIALDGDTALGEQIVTNMAFTI
jgi:uncharacterized protein (TIGR03083 family)